MRRECDATAGVRDSLTKLRRSLAAAVGEASQLGDLPYKSVVKGQGFNRNGTREVSSGGKSLSRLLGLAYPLAQQTGDAFPQEPHTENG